MIDKLEPEEKKDLWWSLAGVALLALFLLGIAWISMGEAQKQEEVNKVTKEEFKKCLDGADFTKNIIIHCYNKGANNAN